MGKQKMKFGSFFDYAGRIFIALTNNQGSISNINRLIKSLEFSAYKVIKLQARLIKDVHDHGSGSCFTMASSYHDAGFLAALLEDIFRKRIDFKVELPRLYELRIIQFSMHSQDNRVNAFINFFREPPCLSGK